MAISDTYKQYLNDMNRPASLAQLGTVIQDLQQGDGSDLDRGNILRGDSNGKSEEYDASGDGKILVGDGTDVASVAVSGDITITSAGVVTIGADKIDKGMINDSDFSGDVTISNGVFTISSGALEPSMIDRDEINVDLTDIPCNIIGVLTDTNVQDVLIHDSGSPRLQIFNELTTSNASTWVRGTGLDVNLDATDNEGCEITPDGFTVSGCDASFVAGTDNFFVESKITIADISGVDEVYVGFKKIEAQQAVFDNYDEAVAINLLQDGPAATTGGKIYIESILNGGTTSETDTTDTLDDTQYGIARIEHSSTVGLSTAIALFDGLKATTNTHYADDTEHTAGLDTAIAGTNDGTLATLITNVSELQDSYVAHDDDSILASEWVYHIAQGTEYALASETNPTDLPECIAVLNDIKAKLNSHVADGVSHTDGDSGVNATADAGSTTFTLGANAALGAPSATAVFTFDDGEEVVPFVRILRKGTDGGAVVLNSFKCGRL